MGSLEVKTMRILISNDSKDFEQSDSIFYLFIIKYYYVI